MKQALLFPGQGAQFISMGKDFYEQFSVAKELFQRADALKNEAFTKVLFEGPESLLMQTAYSQLAIFVVSSAIYLVLEEEGILSEPVASAGLSLGEYTALFASKRLSFEETFSLIEHRAAWMQEACEKPPGTMAAVLGMEKQALAEVIQGIDKVWVANYNCPGQIVISGAKEGVEKASLLLKESGAKRVLPLPVSGAFHTPFMQEAEGKLQKLLEGITLKDSSFFLGMNASGMLHKDSIEILGLLKEQMTHSVYWEQTICSMEALGVEEYLEIGPGSSLSGFNRKMGLASKTIKIGSVEDLSRVRKCSSC